MDNPKHTPGPWEQHTDNKTFVYAPSGELVAKTLSPMGLPNRAKANARLIAAAPDLLDTLKKAHDTFIDTGRALRLLNHTTMAQAMFIAADSMEAEIAKALIT